MTRYRYLQINILFASAYLLATASALCQSQSPAVSTVVHLKFTQTVSSAAARIGQPVALETTEAIVLNGQILVRKGAPAVAEVTEVEHRGHNRRQGNLLVTIRTVQSVDNRQLALHPAQIHVGGAPSDPIFGPCTFPLPADPVGLFRKGKDVVIPAGSEFLVELGPIPE